MNPAIPALRQYLERCARGRAGVREVYTERGEEDLTTGFTVRLADGTELSVMIQEGAGERAAEGDILDRIPFMVFENPPPLENPPPGAPRA